MALKVTLWLEKLYLTDQVTSAKNTSKKVGQDIWEKRQMKVVKKLRDQLINSLNALQLIFDAKAHMEDDDQDYQLAELAASDDKLKGSAQFLTYESFDSFVSKVIIEPFGARLYHPLNELATELELSDKLIDELKKKAQKEGCWSRKFSRKPVTPSKII